ncbi:MAG: hypothetical protein R2939_09605 [Kofleriaceae bacterium]
MRHHLAALTLALAASSTVASCNLAQDLLNKPRGGKPDLKVEVSAVTLEQRPTDAQLAAFYCSRNAGPLSFACRAFGPVPAQDQLRFTFKVELEAQNPSPVPVPVVSALVGFTAYPAATGAQNLGALCVSLCEDPSRCPQAENACSSNEPEIRSTRDFVGAAIGFVANAALTGGASLETLRMPLVPAGGRIRFQVALTLDVPQMLALIERLGGDALADVRAGRMPSFEIPWAVEGSVFATVQGFGRFGVNFPRQTGTWQL